MAEQSGATCRLCSVCDLGLLLTAADVSGPVSLQQLLSKACCIFDGLQLEEPQCLIMQQCCLMACGTLTATT